MYIIINLKQKYYIQNNTSIKVPTITLLNNLIQNYTIKNPIIVF